MTYIVYTAMSGFTFNDPGRGFKVQISFLMIRKRGAAHEVAKILLAGSEGKLPTPETHDIQVHRLRTIRTFRACLSSDLEVFRLGLGRLTVTCVHHELN